MELHGINIFTGNHGFLKGDIYFDRTIDGIFLTGPEDPEADYLIPGLIDIHSHGNSGECFNFSSYEGLCKMADYYASSGITSFAGTTLTSPLDKIEYAIRNGVSFVNKRESGAVLRAIHLEGPFFSYNKRGGQNPNHLLLPDLNALKRLFEISDGLLRICDVAPELEGAMEFIKVASKLITVGVAHTEADFNLCTQAFENGARHLIHSFNAMNPIKGRDPGPIIAACEAEGVTAEVIGDGKHIAPANVRLLFKIFGADRIVLVSDSLNCCGMAEGDYILGSQHIIVKDGLGYLEDGTIAGAASNLFQNLRSVISFGIPREDAIRSATINPARVIQADKYTGSIETGKDADLLVCDHDFNLKQVYVQGSLQKG